MVLSNLYISFDVETNGNNPLLHSMISIGMVGITIDGTNIFKFTENIMPLADHTFLEDTMNFWNKHPKEYELTQISQQYYLTTFKKISDLLTEYGKTYNIVFIAWPASFDWMFFKCYYEKFIGEYYDSVDKSYVPYNIGYRCICISSMLRMTKTKFDTNQWLNNIKKSYIETEPIHNVEHDPLYDAIIQGKFFIALINEFGLKDEHFT